jgi:hypothetical protein
MSDIEAKRAANRAAFPGVAKIVDEFRAEFGDGVKVDGGSENGSDFGVMQEDLPDSEKVFSGKRLVRSFQPFPIEIYKQYGMGIKKR